MDEQSLQKMNSLNSNRRSLLNRCLFGLFFVFLLMGSFWLGYTKGKKNSGFIDQDFPITQTEVTNKIPAKKNIDFSLFWKVWNLLEEKYIEKNSLDAQQLVYGAIRGMLHATNDPYTAFFDPKETKSFSQDLEGSFEGIGAELGIKDSILTIIAPLADSPAAKAGLRAGDKVLKISDKSTADMTIEEAVDLIRGKKGTEVKLIILRQGEETAQEISVIRDIISIKSVELEFKPLNLAYLKITKFGDSTSKEFDMVINKILANNTNGIILDLRNNPGGFLDEAISLASRMIPKRKVVVFEEDYTGKKEALYALGGDKLSSIPMVVLINEGSASASEILAGALRDNREIKIIGKKSFGKGSVQELIDLPKASSVKITIAKWMTPNGDYIMDKGISPDIEVDLTLDDFKNNRDPQLDKALEIMQEMLK